MAETQPQLHPALLRLSAMISQYFTRRILPLLFSMAAHQQMRICCASELEEVVVVGEVAYTRSRDALSVTPRAGGKAAQLAGHRLTVYRKQRDGRWLLSRDVHTLSAVA